MAVKCVEHQSSPMQLWCRADNLPSLDGCLVSPPLPFFVTEESCGCTLLMTLDFCLYSLIVTTLDRLG